MRVLTVKLFHCSVFEIFHSKNISNLWTKDEVNKKKHLKVRGPGRQASRPLLTPAHEKPQPGRCSRTVAAPTSNAASEVLGHRVAWRAGGEDRGKARPPRVRSLQLAMRAVSRPLPVSMCRRPWKKRPPGRGSCSGPVSSGCGCGPRPPAPGLSYQDSQGVASTTVPAGSPITAFSHGFMVLPGTRKNIFLSF